ncbi:MAG: class I mannose-6-phosphate isomerase [Bacteroidales bacterium]|nr:class I mannose-6-phosphate isomerase [Bacteroidales bacterium]
MENNLYPVKFKPIVKPKIWGGESWQISGVEGDVSVVDNGFLAGNTLDELLEVYMGDLVGDSVYEKFGNEFPLLIKFINAKDRLSVQVHPDDTLAAERHNSFGKTEMWYVLDCEPDATLVNGFNREITKEEYLDALNSGHITDILNTVKVKRGDVFFIPAGRVHAIGSGNYIAEIQQTSDVTYRIYDYDRRDSDGNTRELHTELAVDAIDYKFYNNYRTDYVAEVNKTVNVVDCKYFHTSVFELDMPVEKDFPEIDSFIIYMCTGGSCRIEYDDAHSSVDIKQGETVLIPAAIKNLCFYPEGKTTLLEVYVK